MARGDKKDNQAATFRLPPDTLERLEQENARTGVPKGVIVDRALRAWFAAQEGDKDGGGDAPR